MQKQISILLLFFFFTFNSFSQDTLQEIKVRGNSKSLKKIIISAVIFILGLFLASNYLGENFKYMLSKNGGEIENIDTHSRDDLWNARIREFKENPLF